MVIYFNAELLELYPVVLNELSDLDLELCGCRCVQCTAENVSLVEFYLVTADCAGSCSFHAAGTSADNYDVLGIFDLGELHCVFIAGSRIDSAAEL